MQNLLPCTVKMWEGTSFWLPRRRHTNHDWAESRREKIGNWFSSKKIKAQTTAAPLPSLRLSIFGRYPIISSFCCVITRPFFPLSAVAQLNPVTVQLCCRRRVRDNSRLAELVTFSRLFPLLLPRAPSAGCTFCPDIRRYYFKTLQCNLQHTGTMMEFFKQPFATAKKNIYSTAEGGRFLAPQLCCDTWQKPIERAREGGGEIMDRS